MILPFSTQLNGKPTFFVEKIISSLARWNKISYDKASELLNKPMADIKQITPKLHTIRWDINKRWKTGNDIHFYINNRTPNMFQFAPVMKVVSTQRIFMSVYLELEISIDGRQLTHAEIDELYKNDGFDNYDDFEEYFLSMMNDDLEFSGKIIHWTEMKY